MSRPGRAKESVKEPPKDLSFRDAAILWLDQTGSTLSESTLRQYKLVIHNYLLPLLTDTPMRRIDLAYAEALVGNLKKRGIAKSTVVSCRAALRNILSWWFSYESPPSEPWPEILDRVLNLFPDAPVTFYIRLLRLGFSLSSIRQLSRRDLDEDVGEIMGISVPASLVGSLEEFARGRELVFADEQGVLPGEKAMGGQIYRYLKRFGLEAVSVEDLRQAGTPAQGPTLRAEEAPHARPGPHFDSAALLRLLQTDPQHPGALIARLAWQLGLNRRMIFGLTWEQLDLDRGQAQLTGQALPAPIPRDLLLLLREQRKEHPAYPNVVLGVRGRPLSSEAAITLTLKNYLEPHGLKQISMGDLVLAHKRGQLPEDPLSDQGSAPPQWQEEGTWEEAVMDAVRRDPGLPGALLVLLALQLGLRPREIRTLTWDQLDLHQAQARVNGRVIPIPEEAGGLLLSLLARPHPDGAVIRLSLGGSPQSTNALANAVRVYLTPHGLGHVTLTDLRRMYGIGLLRSGLSVREAARQAGFADQRSFVSFVHAKSTL